MSRPRAMRQPPFGYADTRTRHDAAPDEPGGGPVVWASPGCVLFIEAMWHGDYQQVPVDPEQVPSLIAALEKAREDASLVSVSVGKENPDGVAGEGRIPEEALDAGVDAGREASIEREPHACEGCGNPTSNRGPLCSICKPACEWAGHDWADVGGGLLVCQVCAAEKWADAAGREVLSDAS